MATNKLKVKVSTRKDSTGAERYEGTVSINGLKSTKLQKPDGSTVYPTRTALLSSVRSLAKRLGSELQEEPLQQAAKKSVKKTPAKTCPAKTCSGNKTKTKACSGTIDSPPWMATS